MNSSEYITQTLLNNLVGMKYKGNEIVEARPLSNSESREFNEVLLVRYKRRGFSENLFIHPAWVKRASFSTDRIEIVVNCGLGIGGNGLVAEYIFTK
jgi:hypothetical protein